MSLFPGNNPFLKEYYLQCNRHGLNLTFPTNAGLLQGKGRCVKRGVSQLPTKQCLSPGVTRKPELPYLEDVHALHNHWALKA